MSNIVIYDPDDSAVPNRVTRYLKSVHTPDWESVDSVIINPDLSGVASVPQMYWKESSGAIVEMSNAEKLCLNEDTCQQQIKSLGYLYNDEFIGRTHDPKYWRSSTNGGSGRVFIVPDAEGGILALRSGKCANKWAKLSFSTGYNQFSAECNASMIAICKMEDISNTYVELGLCKDAKYIRFQCNGDGNWYSSTKDVTATTVDTGITPANEWHKFKIATSAIDVKFYIDDILVSTHTTDIPQVTLSPYLYQKTISGSSVCDLLVDCVELKGDRIP